MSDPWRGGGEFFFFLGGGKGGERGRRGSPFVLRFEAFRRFIECISYHLDDLDYPKEARRICKTSSGPN